MHYYAVQVHETIFHHYESKEICRAEVPNGFAEFRKKSPAFLGSAQSIQI
jgi:hypothetical protein